jgi:hypothetical protein
VHAHGYGGVLLRGVGLLAFFAVATAVLLVLGNRRAPRAAVEARAARV